MTSESVVADASIVVRLLLTSGAATSNLSARLSHAVVHAPEHIGVEVMSALRRLRLAGSVSEPEAMLALFGLWRLPIETWRIETLADRTWQLGHNVSSYDAAYVALAERLDAPLLTCDARLARASGPTCTFEVFD